MNMYENPSIIHGKMWGKGTGEMPNYEKMYAVLCGAVDDVMDELARIPFASPAAERLRAALEQAEEIYIRTSAYTTETDGNIIEFRCDASGRE